MEICSEINLKTWHILKILMYQSSLSLIYVSPHPPVLHHHFEGFWVLYFSLMQRDVMFSSHYQFQWIEIIRHYLRHGRFPSYLTRRVAITRSFHSRPFHSNELHNVNVQHNAIKILLIRTEICWTILIVLHL